MYVIRILINIIQNYSIIKILLIITTITRYIVCTMYIVFDLSIKNTLKTKKIINDSL